MASVVKFQQLNPIANNSTCQLVHLSEDKFVVPYQQNKHFTGRKYLLELLKITLFSEEPKDYTEWPCLDLEELEKLKQPSNVYVNQIYYERVYWVSASTQAALVPRYQHKATET
jgi:hypothetical protein